MAQKEIFNSAMKTLSRHFPTLNSQISLPWESLSMSYYLKMITEAFQVILKYVAPGQEDIVIQNVCKKLSFASNDSEETLDTMTEAYQQQNDRINQLQILFLFAH
jgi:hypothetical protein